MIDVVIGTIYIFILLTLIGFGPTLCIFKDPLVKVIAIAPVIGLALTTVIGMYLILLDFPIAVWAKSWTYISIFLSMLSAFYAMRTYPIVSDRKFWYFLLGLFFTTMIILAPILVGGFEFTMWRGNAADTINYLTMAGFIGHEPYSMSKLNDMQLLMNKHPSYPLAAHLLTERWAVVIPLFWGTQLSHLPLHQFEYGYTCLYFIMAYCCSFIIGSLFSIKMRYILLISIAISIGFWAQVVMDIRALSQISSIPLLLLYVLLLNQSYEEEWNYLHQMTFGFVIGTIVFLYIEIIPLLVLATLLFFCMGIKNQKNNILMIVKKYWLSAIVLFTLIAPCYQHLWVFFIKQVGSLSFRVGGGAQAFFPWVYSDHLINFWGHFILIHLFSKNSILLVLLKIGFYLLGTLLIILFIFILLYSSFKKETSALLKIIAAFILSALCMFIFLYSKGQLWSAAKAILYAYPFIIFFIAIAGIKIISQIKAPRLLLKLCKYSVILWLCLQCSLGLIRIAYAYVGKPFSHPPYVMNHYLYLKYKWQIETITKALRAYKIHSVGIIYPDDYVHQYLALVWGWDFKVINFNKKNKNRIPISHTVNQLPEYVVISSNWYHLDHIQPIASTQDLMLVKPTTATWKQIYLLSATFNGGWLWLNKNINIPSELLSKKSNNIIDIAGELPKDRFTSPVNLILKINNKIHIIQKITPGSFHTRFVVMPADDLTSTVQFKFLVANCDNKKNIDSKNLDTSIYAIKINSMKLISL